MPDDLESRVCPQCGQPAHNDEYCRACGLHLAAQYELPTAAEWRAQHPAGEQRSRQPSPPVQAEVGLAAASAPAPRSSRWLAISPLEVVALSLALGGAVIALVAIFVPWFSASAEGFTETANFWKISEASDILMLTTIVLAVGLWVARVFAYRYRAVRALAAVALGAVVAYLLLPAIEILTSENRVLENIGADSGSVSVSVTQPGEIMAIVGALVLLAAGILLAIADARLALDSSMGSSSRRGWSLALAGLVLLMVGAASQPLAFLLPGTDDMSIWENNEIFDILATLRDVALVGIAAAVLAARKHLLLIASVLLGAWLAMESISNSIESLASDSTGAAIFVLLFVIGPLAAAGTALAAVGGYPERSRRS